MIHILNIKLKLISSLSPIAADQVQFVDHLLYKQQIQSGAKVLGHRACGRQVVCKLIIEERMSRGLMCSHYVESDAGGAELETHL